MINVVLIDVFPIKDGESSCLVFESVCSPWKQGIWLMTDKSISLAGEYGKSQ